MWTTRLNCMLAPAPGMILGSPRWIFQISFLPAPHFSNGNATSGSCYEQSSDYAQIKWNRSEKCPRQVNTGRRPPGGPADEFRVCFPPCLNCRIVAARRLWSFFCSGLWKKALPDFAINIEERDGREVIFCLLERNLLFHSEFEFPGDVVNVSKIYNSLFIG